VAATWGPCNTRPLVSHVARGGNHAVTEAYVLDNRQCLASWAMAMRIRCDCGHEIVTNESAALLTEARRHARETHQMEMSAERILALAEPCEDKPELPPGVAEQGHGGVDVDAKS
jgi:Protein of unknown function (DUF1059)